MNRNTVIVDGTKAGSPDGLQLRAAVRRTSARRDADGKADGRNGIVVWKANDVSVENLTACNFLGGRRRRRQRDLVERRRRHRARSGSPATPGSYLTATSTYFGGEATAAQYGIFSSNAQGPGIVEPDLRAATSTTRACTSAPACRSAT